jgi:c-di-GMP-binding flagellar brake protein YcgR
MSQEVYRSYIRAENRRYPRIRLKLWVQYKRLKKGEESGMHESLAEDLGARGMAMRSDHPMRLGQLLMLTLFLPPEGRREDADQEPVFDERDCVPVDILSRVAWCKPFNDQEYMLGVEFMDPDPSHRSRLKSFLVDYNLDQPNSALYT